MSTISFRPRGGQEGIEVTKDEMLKFSLAAQRNYIDEVIPLPDKSVEQQIELLKSCEHSDEIYWETPEGNHGWCCPLCGLVTQWG